jgi:hypothetical protein
VDFIGARALDGGRLETRHRVKEQPQMLLVTTFTPEPGAVEIIARAVLDTEKYPNGKLPDTLLTPNLCWQLHRVPAFASKPEPYPEFVKRCFIFCGDAFKSSHFGAFKSSQDDLAVKSA